ncbi:MAG: tRNA uridine-5-carboxymethylaminomethyl(34) synthesis GTPase MnmE [Betaproteobacteria bacterium]|nr:tRNA uridine-5-carboxymethylaminomethyl(34) synthesis GTPase MnmE [Betaproteobacteria bacterium]
MGSRPDTIAAIATAPGRGGIGIVRVSGALAGNIARAVTGGLPPARRATFARFTGTAGALLDEGIALFFPAPRSYTGEDVLELQGHGGPVVLREILRRCVELGARLAEPGEFTRRAFLNDRLDLAQAEGVADLIDAASAEAARGAARSLAGEFSARIDALVASLTRLRMHVEACIDFPEEEIDPADRQSQREALAAIRADLAELLEEAAQGAVLREGLTVVLAGRPNVGKSSLLNRLAGEDVAIVTPVAGTTRDYVRATILLEGVPIHLIDTAGLRDAGDEVERIGIARTWEAIAKAGAAMLVTDAGHAESEEDTRILERMPRGLPLARVTNKIDLAGLAPGREAQGTEVRLRLSAKTGEGVPALRAWLLEVAGWRPSSEGVFLARERHLVALREAAARLQAAAEENMQVFELYAEDLRLAQQSLGAITGEVTPDELLGQIFSRFCIGK